MSIYPAYRVGAPRLDRRGNEDRHAYDQQESKSTARSKRRTGLEAFNLFNQAKGEVIGQVILADREDARRAIVAAIRALPAFSRTSVAERIDMLRRLHAAVSATDQIASSR